MINFELMNPISHMCTFRCRWSMLMKDWVKMFAGSNTINMRMALNGNMITFLRTIKREAERKLMTENEIENENDQNNTLNVTTYSQSDKFLASKNIVEEDDVDRDYLSNSSDENDNEGVRENEIDENPSKVIKNLTTESRPLLYEVSNVSALLQDVDMESQFSRVSNQIFPVTGEERLPLAPPLSAGMFLNPTFNNKNVGIMLPPSTQKTLPDSPSGCVSVNEENSGSLVDLRWERGIDQLSHNNAIRIGKRKPSKSTSNLNPQTCGKAWKSKIPPSNPKNSALDNALLFLQSHQYQHQDQHQHQAFDKSLKSRDDLSDSNPRGIRENIANPTRHVVTIPQQQSVTPLGESVQQVPNQDLMSSTAYDNADTSTAGITCDSLSGMFPYLFQSHETTLTSNSKEMIELEYPQNDKKLPASVVNKNNEVISNTQFTNRLLLDSTQHSSNIAVSTTKTGIPQKVEADTNKNLYSTAMTHQSCFSAREALSYNQLQFLSNDVYVPLIERSTTENILLDDKAHVRRKEHSNINLMSSLQTSPPLILNNKSLILQMSDVDEDTLYAIGPTIEDEMLSHIDHSLMMPSNVDLDKVIYHTENKKLNVAGEAISNTNINIQECNNENNVVMIGQSSMSNEKTFSIVENDFNYNKHNVYLNNNDNNNHNKLDECLTREPGMGGGGGEVVSHSVERSSKKRSDKKQISTKVNKKMYKKPRLNENPTRNEGLFAKVMSATMPPSLLK